MCAAEKPTQAIKESLKVMFRCFLIVVVFGIAFAYIESAVVVYLRAIFYPDGFTFPLSGFAEGALWRRLLLTEIGREAATLVLIFTGSWLFGRNKRQRFAFFLTIFAVWDIFYYVWLKVLLDWPATINDWDILFLMPAVWASPVMAPVLISLTMLIFAVTILYRDCYGKAVKVSAMEWLAFVVAAVLVVLSFCLAGRYIKQIDYKVYFSWPLFAIGHLLAVLVFLKCLLKPSKTGDKSIEIKGK
jgi:hypothetical protein